MIGKTLSKVYYVLLAAVIIGIVGYAFRDVFADTQDVISFLKQSESY